MTHSPQPQIPLPTFADLATFSLAQLEAMLIAWEWIRDQPEWAMWHDGAKDFINKIEAELNQRTQERARLSLRRAVADWGMANDRFWGPNDTQAATNAVEKLLAQWGENQP